MFASRLKQLALRWLPAPVLFELKKYHYAHRLPRFDDPETTFVRVLVDTGDQVLDVGANVGWYTHLLSRQVGLSGRVLSVEPIPETHRLLAGLIRRLGLQNVTVLQKAVSDQLGSVVMEVPLWDTGGENYYQAHIVTDLEQERGLRRSKVERTTIDELSRELLVSFIKADVEGHELQVVRGASETIRRSRPAWLLEVIGDPDREGTSASQVCETLGGFGYVPYLISNGKLVQRSAGDRSANYFFLSENHVKRLLEIDPALIDQAP